MKHVRTFESFRNNKGLEPVNEEFVLGLLKGALSKVMAAFGNTFKDMVNDFKNAFKADDPNSIKGIIMTNFNQAVDGAQKNLNDKLVDEAGVGDMMNKMIDSLVGLATGIDKDIDTAVGKDKSAGAKAVAKAIILGSKEAAWAGIVGLLDPTKGKSGMKTTYKYSKMNYDLSLAKLPDLKAKKAAASKFLDNMQKDIQAQLDKEFSEEEIKKLYDDSMAKAKQGGGESSITFDQYQEFFDKKSPIIYLLKDKTKEDWDKLSDDQKSKPSEKPASDIVGVKVVDELNKSNTNLIDAWIVRFIGKDGKKITKFPKEIIGVSGSTQSEDAKKAADSLGKIKNDPEKMKKVAMFSDFLQDDKNKDKVAEIEKIIAPEGGGE
jgi:hypothetical protein